MHPLMASACTVFGSLVLAFFATDKVCLLHEAYQLRTEKIEKESWLREQCAKPEFYSRMRYHTSLCEDVDATWRTGAAWHALREVAGSLPVADCIQSVQRMSWQFFAVLALALLLFPSLFISQMRTRTEQLPMYYKNNV